MNLHWSRVKDSVPNNSPRLKGEESWCWRKSSKRDWGGSYIVHPAFSMFFLSFQESLLFLFCFFLILRREKNLTTSNRVCLLFCIPWGGVGAAEGPRDNRRRDIKAHKQTRTACEEKMRMSVRFCVCVLQFTCLGNSVCARRHCVSAALLEQLIKLSLWLPNMNTLTIPCIFH